MSQKVEVQLLAKAAELAATHKVTLEVKESTPKAILQELAKGNPLLKDQIVRADGLPRSSTRILVNGVPPSSLDEVLAAGAELSVAVVMPCDG
jgi:molybdopterin converting factor small subunit